MTAAVEGGEWLAARPCRTLPLGYSRYPLYRRLGGPQGRSGRAENLVPIGIRPRTLQPVAQSTELPGPRTSTLRTAVGAYSSNRTRCLCQLWWWTWTCSRHVDGTFASLSTSVFWFISIWIEEFYFILTVWCPIATVCYLLYHSGTFQIVYSCEVHRERLWSASISTRRDVSCTRALS